MTWGRPYRDLRLSRTVSTTRAGYYPKLEGLISNSQTIQRFLTAHLLEQTQLTDSIHCVDRVVPGRSCVRAAPQAGTPPGERNGDVQYCAVPSAEGSGSIQSLPRDGQHGQAVSRGLCTNRISLHLVLVYVATLTTLCLFRRGVSVCSHADSALSV